MSILPQSPDDKRCSKCKEFFSRTDEFWHKDKRNKDGYQGQCKQCRSKTIRLWQLKNPEKAKEIDRRRKQKIRRKLKNTRKIIILLMQAKSIKECVNGEKTIRIKSKDMLV